MPEIVFALYRPKPDRADDLLAIAKEHVPALRKLGLVTGRAPIVARSRKDGTIIEVFEWASALAIERAHRHPVVQKHWARFAECAEYPTFGQLAEAGDVFAGFEPVGESVARKRAGAAPKIQQATKRVARGARARKR